MRLLGCLWEAILERFGVFWELFLGTWRILSVWFRRGVGKAIIAVPMHLLVLLFWDCCAIVVVLLLDYFVPVLLLVSSSTVWMSPDQLLDAASR